MITSSDVWDLNAQEFERKEERQSSAVFYESTYYDGKGKILNDHLMTITSGCYYGQLGQTVRINSLRRERNVELLSETTLVNRRVHSIHIATYVQKGDELSGWISMFNKTS